MIRELLLNQESDIYLKGRASSIRRRSSKKYADGVYISGSDFLEIKMSRKVIQQAQESGLEGHSMVGDQAKMASNKYEFTVILITVQRRYKVKKTYGQILELEKHVSDLIAQYEAKDPSSSVFKSLKLLFPSRKWASQS
jgi:hypothetical protein